MNPIDVLHGAAILVAIAALYLGWRHFWLSQVRHSMFNVRDELWDAAARGEVSFDHPHYRNARERLNRSIRFAHTCSNVRMMPFLLVDTSDHVEVTPVGAPPPPVEKALRDLRQLRLVLFIFNAPVAFGTAILIGALRTLPAAGTQRSEQLATLPRRTVDRFEDALDAEGPVALVA